MLIRINLKKSRFSLFLFFLVMSFLYNFSNNADAGGVSNLFQNLSANAIEPDRKSPDYQFRRTFLTEEEKKDLLALGYDSSWGELTGVYDTGFDIYEDTPAFDNFTGFLKPVMGEGTCVGISHIIKKIFLKVEFVEGEKNFSPRELLIAIATNQKIRISGYSSLREFSRENPDGLKKAMEIAHLDNFDPDSWLPALLRTLGLKNNRTTFNEIKSRLQVGYPSMIAFIATESKPILGHDVNLPVIGRGHCVLAYKAIEFSNKAVIFEYDPNCIYEKSKNNKYTTWLFDRNKDEFKLHPESYASWYPWASMYTCIENQLPVLERKFRNFISDAKEKIDTGFEKVKQTISEVWNRFNRGLNGIIRRGQFLFNKLF